ncbi:MAG: HNH endonuclease [Saprospiraceae bacterium]|nr:HNH endonuclease [Candidatus Defluviibacterium haderslevense]
MNELTYCETPELFRIELTKLHALRTTGNLKVKRLARISKEDRKVIHAKTGGKCHVCGQHLEVEKFEADHVKSHSSGGASLTDNFLPACKTCNNYRWHYLADELQWILKLGVWAKTEIEKGSSIGFKMAETFVSREKKREGRRKTPRQNPSSE